MTADVEPRPKTLKVPQQLHELRQYFAYNRYLTDEQCAEVAQSTMITINHVRWRWQREQQYVALIAAATAARLPLPPPYHPLAEPQRLHEPRRCFAPTAISQTSNVLK